MLFDNTMKWVDSFVPMDSEALEGSKSQTEGSKKRIKEELESDNSKKQKIDENVEAEKIIKEGKMGYFQIIRPDGSLRRPDEAYERVLWGDLKVMFEPEVESEVWRNLQGYNVTVWKLFSSSGVHFVRFQKLHIFMLVEKKIKRLHDDLGVNTAKVRVTAAKHNLVLLVILVKNILIILNGDSPLPTRTIDGLETLVPPTTIEQKLARKNELKARGTLLMTLPNEHQLKFNTYKSAKTLIEAIEKRFGGNKESKKLLRSLPSEWKTHTLIWRNKPDLEDLSMDDFTNEAIKTTHGVSAANSKNNASTLPNVDSLCYVEIDLKWQMAMLTIRARRFLKKIGRNLGVNGTDTIGFDKTKVECYNFHRRGAYKAGLESVEAILDVYKNNEVVFEEDIKILKLDIMLRDNALIELKKKFEKAEKERDDLKLTLEKFENSSKNLSKLLDSQVSDKFKTGVGYDSQVFDSQVFDSQMNDKYKSGERYHDVPPPYTGNFMPSKPDLVLADKDEYAFSESATSVPSAATSEVKTSVSKPKESVKKVENNKQAKYLRKNSQSPRGNPQQDWKDKRVIDSGFSRHMTRNKSYLIDYEEIGGGFVAFRGNSKGGKINGKKNSVLFIDTECVVLSPDFKLTNESPVLLKVPRKDNIYSVDLNNVVPQGGLTFLFVKATSDESNLWHKRLRHVNFKTMNKLVRGNLVRGLPSKLFKTNQTCVACQKGKQHKASCKTKTVISISQPL
ncbi:putative ribonuclease H-like domain-containing protein [Tanacetum coccineum]